MGPATRLWQTTLNTGEIMDWIANMTLVFSGVACFIASYDQFRKRRLDTADWNRRLQRAEEYLRTLTDPGYTHWCSHMQDHIISDLISHDSRLKKETRELCVDMIERMRMFTARRSGPYPSWGKTVSKGLNFIERAEKLLLTLEAERASQSKGNCSR